MANFRIPGPSIQNTVNLTGSPTTSTAIASTIGATTMSNPYITVTYTNSYVNYGGTSLPSCYYKDACGIVHVVINAKSGTAATSICTLPAGYRPVGHNLVCANVDGALGYVKFSTDGTVTPLAGGTTSVQCTIQFPGVN